jgi:hypothetical protein
MAVPGAKGVGIVSRTVTLAIPEELDQTLKDFAATEGKSAEEVGATWLAATIERLANDPLLKLAGVLDSGVPDLAEHHDAYLGHDLRQNLHAPNG